MERELSMLKGLAMSQNANNKYIKFMTKVAMISLTIFTMFTILGCSGRLHLNYKTDLSGTKVWGEQDNQKIAVVVSLPHPEGTQIPKLVSLDEPLTFVQNTVPGAVEFRFKIEPGRLAPKKTIRLSVDYGSGPITLILQGPVRTTGQSTANTIFWTLVSSI